MVQQLDLETPRYSDLLINQLFHYVVNVYGEETWNSTTSFEIQEKTMEYYIEKYGRGTFQDLVQQLCKLIGADPIELLREFSEAIQSESIVIQQLI